MSSKWTSELDNMYHVIYTATDRTDPDADRAFFAPEFLGAFIEKYRSLSCLWKIKSSDYCNTLQRQRCWEELCVFCEKINPAVTTQWVKKKLHNIRNSFRKESKKVRASRKSGEETYKPKLWYYELMLFLNDNEAPRGSLTNINSDDEAACAADEEQDIKVETTEITPKQYDEDRSINPGVPKLHRIENESKSISPEVPNLHWIEKNKRFPLVLMPKLKDGDKTINPEVPNLHRIENENKSINPELPKLHRIESKNKSINPELPNLHWIERNSTSKLKDEDKAINSEVPNLHRIENENKSINPEVPNLHWIERNTATSLKRKKYKRKLPDEREKDPLSTLLKKARIELEQKDEEYEAIGKAVAAKLRKIGNMDYMQFIYADKIINDALYKALLQQLSPADIINEPRHVPQIPSVPVYSLNTNSSPSSSQSCQGWPLKSSPASSNSDSLQSPPPSISY